MKYELRDGVLYVQIDGGGMINQSFHPETNDPITDQNVKSVLELMLPSHVLDSDRKLTGIEFEGVMCSATRDDQSGLTAVFTAYQMVGQDFKPSRFDFSNGNSLVLTKDNLLQFVTVWMPFRQSFFVPSSAVA